jgi:hypothetical protein
MEKQKPKKIAIVRTCVGCILPETAQLIGSGTYSFIRLGIRETEYFYDYQIYEDELDEFLDINESILIENALIKIPEKEAEPSEDKIKEVTANRGYRKK